MWRIGWSRDWEGTKRLAEDEGRTRVTDTVVLIAAVASLAAVVQALLRSGTSDAVGVLAVVLGVLVVIVSWALVNTVFALKYARRYYGDPEGGIDFAETTSPDFLDFAYVAFTLGMTYQVSDTAFTTCTMRRLALGHSLLGFLFGTFIVAVTINVVAGFV